MTNDIHGSHNKEIQVIHSLLVLNNGIFYFDTSNHIVHIIACKKHWIRIGLNIQFQNPNCRLAKSLNLIYYVVQHLPNPYNSNIRRKFYYQQSTVKDYLISRNRVEELAYRQCQFKRRRNKPQKGSVSELFQLQDPLSFINVLQINEGRINKPSLNRYQ